MNIYTGYEATAEKLRSGLWRYRGFIIERCGTITKPPYYWKIVGVCNQKFPQLGDARRHIDRTGGKP